MSSLTSAFEPQWYAGHWWLPREDGWILWTGEEWEPLVPVGSDADDGEEPCVNDSGPDLASSSTASLLVGSDGQPDETKESPQPLLHEGQWWFQATGGWLIWHDGAWEPEGIRRSHLVPVDPAADPEGLDSADHLGAQTAAGPFDAISRPVVELGSSVLSRGSPSVSHVKAGPRRGRSALATGALAVSVLLLITGTVYWIERVKLQSTVKSTINTNDPTPSSASSSPLATIVLADGLGASIGRWNTSHKPAPNWPAGGAYDTDPSLPPSDGHPGTRFMNVALTDNMISSFRVNFALHSSLSSARSYVAGLLPPDTGQQSELDLVNCTVVSLHSTQLGEVFASDDQNGAITAIYKSPTVPFSMANVTIADVSIGSQPSPHC